MGAANGGDWIARRGQIVALGGTGPLWPEPGDARNDFPAARIYFYFDDSCGDGVALIEREFKKAAGWSLAAAVFSAIGLIHAYELTPAGIAARFGLLEAPEFAASYLLLALLFFACALSPDYRRKDAAAGSSFE